jgi:hypothetical protein
MEDTPIIQEYRALEKKRLDIMASHNGEDCEEEEDAVLDEMDAMWWTLNDAEVDYLNTHNGPYHDETVRWIDVYLQKEKERKEEDRRKHPMTFQFFDMKNRWREHKVDIANLRLQIDKETFKALLAETHDRVGEETMKAVQIGLKFFGVPIHITEWESFVVVLGPSPEVIAEALKHMEEK